MDFVLQRPPNSFLHPLSTSLTLQAPHCTELGRAGRKTVLQMGRLRTSLRLSKVGEPPATAADRGLEAVLSPRLYRRCNLSAQRSPGKLLTNTLVQRFCFSCCVRSWAREFFKARPSTQPGLKTTSLGGSTMMGMLVRCVTELVPQACPPHHQGLSSSARWPFSPTCR